MQRVHGYATLCEIVGVPELAQGTSFSMTAWMHRQEERQVRMREMRKQKKTMDAFLGGEKRDGRSADSERFLLKRRKKDGVEKRNLNSGGKEKSILSFFSAMPSPSKVDLSSPMDCMTPRKEESRLKSVSSMVDISPSSSCCFETDVQFSEKDITASSSSPITVSVTNQESLLPRSSSSIPYFVQNFLIVLDDVLFRYKPLFSAAEMDALLRVRELDSNSLQLFVRLYNRKSSIFPVRKLSYDKIIDLSETAKNLCTAPNRDCSAWLPPLFLECDESNTDFRELVESLSMDEIMLISKRNNISHPLFSSGNFSDLSSFDESNPRNHKTKSEMIHFIISSSMNNPFLHDDILREVGFSVRIHPFFADLLTRMERLFFLNNSQHSSMLYLTSTSEKISFFPYEAWHQKSASVHATRHLPFNNSKQHDWIDRACKGLLFRSQKHLEWYEEGIEFSQRFCRLVSQEAPLESLYAMIQDACERVAQCPHIDGILFGSELLTSMPFLRRFSCGSMYALIVTVGIGSLEAEKRYEDAILYIRTLLDLPYCPSRRGRWWNRMSINFDHLDQKENALLCLEEALTDENLGPADLLTLQRRLTRLWKPPLRWRSCPAQTNSLLEARSIQISGRPRDDLAVGHRRFVGFDGSMVTVEELALQHYAESESLCGLHCEGSLFMTLFGIFFLDIIFDDSIPFVFQSQYQDCPLDLGSRSFYPQRRAQIETRLVDLLSQDQRESIFRRNYAFSGCICRGLQWNILPDETGFLQVCECIGGHRLAQVLRLYAEDFSERSSGFPDLCLWNPDQKSFKISEVKGGLDKLSDQQRVWIDTLLRIGFEVELCLVSYSPSMPNTDDL